MSPVEERCGPGDGGVEPFHGSAARTRSTQFIATRRRIPQANPRSVGRRHVKCRRERHRPNPSLAIGDAEDSVECLIVTHGYEAFHGFTPLITSPNVRCRSLLACRFASESAFARFEDKQLSSKRHPRSPIPGHECVAADSDEHLMGTVLSASSSVVSSCEITSVLPVSGLSPFEKCGAGIAASNHSMVRALEHTSLSSSLPACRFDQANRRSRGSRSYRVDEHIKLWC